MKAKVKKILKKFFQWGLVTLILIIAIVTFANWKISSESQKYIYTNIDSIPEHTIALVLGTARYVSTGPNQYFTNRIQAAKELYEAGKIDAIVVSGDNRHVSYNEPREMRRALVEVGVPDSIINQDFAGLRTLDSVIRMKEIFGQKKFIVVSQQFHNERAIFIARYYGIEAYGYNATDLKLNKFSVKTKVRELFARVKVFVDIVLGTEPKFLGDPIDIYENRNSEKVIKSDSDSIASPASDEHP